MKKRIYDKRPLLSGLITFVLLSLCLIFGALSYNMQSAGRNGRYETTAAETPEDWTSVQQPDAGNREDVDGDSGPTTFPEFEESSVVMEITTPAVSSAEANVPEAGYLESSISEAVASSALITETSTSESSVSEKNSSEITASDTGKMTAANEMGTSASSAGPRQIPYGFISLIFLVLALASLVIYLLKYRRQEQVFSIEIALGIFLLALALLTHFAMTLAGVGAVSGQQNVSGYGIGTPVLLSSVIAAAMFVISVRIVFGWMMKKTDLSWSLLYRGIRNYRKEERKLYPLVLFPSIVIMILLILCGLAGFGMLWLFGNSSAGIASLSRRRLLVTGLAFFLVLLVLFIILTVRILIKNISAADEIQREIVSDAMTSERYRTDLVANVSHDLRTPLTSIIGYGELLEKEDLSTAGREQLDRLNEKTRYLREMVDELFELTKVSSGVTGIKKERIDLVKLLEQTLGIYNDELDAAHLEIRRNYAAETAPLDTDGTLLNQVFSNLFTNAVKYALPGTRVHIVLLDEEDAWHVKVINVSNYEMKFDEKEILERFTRADESRHSEGSGLGLAIARTYTEVLGGSFYVTVDGDQFTAHVVMKKPE